MITFGCLDLSSKTAEINHKQTADTSSALVVTNCDIIFWYRLGDGSSNLPSALGIKETNQLRPAHVYFSCIIAHSKTVGMNMQRSAGFTSISFVLFNAAVQQNSRPLCKCNTCINIICIHRTCEEGKWLPEQINNYHTDIIVFVFSSDTLFSGAAAINTNYLFRCERACTWCRSDAAVMHNGGERDIKGVINMSVYHDPVKRGVDIWGWSNEACSPVCWDVQKLETKDGISAGLNPLLSRPVSQLPFSSTLSCL